MVCLSQANQANRTCEVRLGYKVQTEIVPEDQEFFAQKWCGPSFPYV